MDFVLRHYKENKTFMTEGYNLLEDLGHEFHMQEIAAAKEVLEMRKNPPDGAEELCDCMTDE